MISDLKLSELLKSHERLKRIKLSQQKYKRSKKGKTAQYKAIMKYRQRLKAKKNKVISAQ